MNTILFSGFYHFQLWGLLYQALCEIKFCLSCLSELTSKSNNLYVWLDNWMLLVINKPMINDSLLLFFKTSLIFIQNSLGRKIYTGDNF